ncbi:MAG: nucleoside triphosphate pyrophosphatase [Nitrospinota bacterium]
MRVSEPLILASGSPRRAQLLREAGVALEVAEAPPEVEERTGDGRSPAEAAVGRALAKARWASGRHPGRWVLAADTVVVLGGEVLGKPAGAAGARRMLGRLSGRSHEVLTGYALVNGERRRTGCVRTLVSFRRLDADAIARYVETGEPLDKAGAYAIQGMGGSLVDRVEGSYTNVVGLPVPEVLGALAECGVLAE